MKKISIPLFLSAGLLASACSKYYGCDKELECQEKEPSKGSISVRLTPPSKGDTVKLRLREGNWKEGKLIQSIPTTKGKVTFRAAVQHRYTAEAIYASDGDSLRAYDSGRLDLEDLKNCGEVCYRVDTLELDLQRVD